MENNTIKIYVNLHPKYTYSNLIIQDGYIDFLKKYVSLVDWLSWDFASTKGKPIIHIMGGWSDDEEAIEKHLIRTRVILQRLKDITTEIYIRNERVDEWSLYRENKVFTDEELYKLEIERLHENKHLLWAENDMKKFKKLIDIGLEKGIEPEEDLLKWYEDAVSRFNVCSKIEQDRCLQIRNLFIHNDVCSI